MLQTNIDLENVLQKQQEARVVRRIVFGVLIAIIMSVVIMGVGGYLYIKGAFEPVNSKSKEAVNIKIPLNTPASEIASTLEERGVIKSALVFKYYVKYKNENGFQAGSYELNKSMEMKEIITALKDGKVMKKAIMTITVPEGLRIPEVAQSIANQTNYTEEEVLKKLRDRQFIESLISKYPIISKDILADKVIWPLEGYLFPATYDFYQKNPSLDLILEKMVEKLDSVVAGYQPDIKASDFTTHEILTLASIVEEEAKKKKDRFMVAGVLYNRLKKGMPLQSDVTVTYAQQETKITVTYEDTKVASPYNTYHQKGLPIGPISSPGETAIDAALHPKPNRYYFFFARPSGKVLYSTNLGEHKKIKGKYIQEWHELANKETE